MGWDIAVITVKDHRNAYEGLRSELINPDVKICRTSGFSWSVFIRRLSGGKLKGSAQAKATVKNKGNFIKRILLYFYNNYHKYQL